MAFYHSSTTWMFLNLYRKNIKTRNQYIRLYHKIRDLYGSYESHLNKDVELTGWIRSLRQQKEFNFMHINDGSDSRNIQIVLPNGKLNETTLFFGSSIKVKGKFVKSSHPQQPFEIHADELQVITSCDATKYPFQMKKTHTSEYLRQFPHLRSNIPAFASLLRARNHVNNLVHEFFQHNNLTHIHTPVITQNTCEGGCEVFEVTSPSDKKEPYFLEPAYLTPSAQLHLEALTNSVGDVYTISPTFRAEKSQTRHHLAEFYMIEAELIQMDTLEQLLEFVEKFVKYVCLNAFNKRISVNDLDNVLTKNKTETHKKDIQSLMSNAFVRLTYDDALKLIDQGNSNKKVQKSIKYGDDLGKDHEKYIIEYFNRVPVFVVNYPKSLKPFYMRTNRANTNLVENFDLLVHNVGELVGGSLREYDYDVLVENMKSKKIDIDAYRPYLETKQFGGMLMGGFGVGLERLLQYIYNIDNIRDTCAFPRSWNNCKM